VYTSKRSPQLTPRQLELLRLVARSQANCCYSASMQEMAATLEISRTTAFEHIAALRRKNLLSAAPGRARSLRLTPQGRSLLNNLEAAPPAEETQTADGIPLLGRVAAGRPIDAVATQEHISLPSEFGTGDNIFALQVCGDSMIDDGISDGDYVICRRAKTAAAGQIVVALIDGETTTLKRFYPEKDRARLQPANDNYEPIYSSNCQIQAVAVGLLRKFQK
jgi:repressor LexA